MARLQLQTSIVDRLAIISETDPRGVITQVNDNFCRISGFSRDELIGKTHAMLNSGFHPKSFWKNMFATMARGEVWQAEVRNRAKDGSLYWVKSANAAVCDGDGKLRGYTSLRLDITESKSLENRITHLAFHDGLTDLPNRTLFSERLDQALASAEAGTGIAVLCIDLDRFKEVNDTFGHAAGDKLLKAVADRLSGCLRRTDTVARIGGDEFVVLQISRNPQAEAALLSQRLIEGISSPYDIDGQEMTIGASIGIAIPRPHEIEADNLLRRADMALYHSKAAGRGTFHFFSDEIYAQRQAALGLEHDLPGGHAK